MKQPTYTALWIGYVMVSDVQQTKTKN
jgi:hypothetical protein